MSRIRAGLGTLVCLSVFACGGDEEAAPPPAGTPAAQQPAAAPAAGGAPGDTAARGGAVSQDDSTRLQREVFSYRGAGRDPFLSLLKSSGIRPFVQDVRVIGITYDAQYPGRSVAMLRDTDQKKRYPVRVGDELGLMRISEIRPDAVVVTLDEFGVQRQVILALRRQEGSTQ